jgi:hypothetical protein
MWACAFLCVLFANDRRNPVTPSFIPTPQKNTQPLYPLIGLDSYNAVHVNFGGPSNDPGGNGRPRPFVFDVWRFQRELLGAEVVSFVVGCAWFGVCVCLCLHLTPHKYPSTNKRERHRPTPCCWPPAAALPTTRTPSTRY